MTLRSSTLRSGWISPRLLLRLPSRTVCLSFYSCIHKLNHEFFVVKKQVTICPSALEACKGAEAVVIATEWKEFVNLDWQAVYDGMNKPAFVFDGRLLVDAAKLTKIGFKVTTIGRGQ